MRMAKQSIRAAAAFHPSFVECADLSNIKAPLYIGLAEHDDMVPATLPDDLNLWASKGLVEGVSFDLTIYPGMGHGFAARPNTQDYGIRQQYERAFRETIVHFNKY